MITIHEALLNFVRPSDHSTFSPSSTDRWMACPYSIKASEGIPSESSVYSEEGTLCHSVCEALFYEEYYGIPFPNDLTMQMLNWDMKKPGTSQEMMSCAHTYVDVVTHYLNSDEIGEVIWWGLEKGIPIFPEEGCFGTGDCIIVGTKATATIDYKHGQGKNVQADSPQLKSYAAGVARHLTGLPDDYKFISVVVQPRTDIAPKTAEYSYNEIMHHLGLIWEAIQESKTASEPCEGSHCYWCPAKRTKDPTKKCPAIADKAFKVAQEDFGKFLEDMHVPNKSLANQTTERRDAAILKVISLLPLMKKIAEDGEAEFMYRMEKGETIPGVKLVEEPGKRQWVFDKDESMISALKVNFPDLNPVKEIPATTKLMTITEVEKIVGKNKCDGLTIKKITKKVKVEDSKVQEVLNELSSYNNMLMSGGDNND